MSKSKRARPIKARSASKVRSKAAARKSAAPHTDASEFQAGAGAGAAAPAERGHDRQHHGNPPAGSRTRCAGSLPAWCARSSGSSLPPRRPTAAVSTGSLAAKPAAIEPDHRCPAERVIMRRRWREPAAIAAEIDRIRSLRLDALRRQWRLVFGRMPPAGLSKDLLGRMIAARLQERAFGGLDRDSLRFLESLARHERPPRRQLKPGTVLVREYQGQRHTVTTVREGFEWQGTTYPSLSAIARAITGTAWSGPRFFALQRSRRRQQVQAQISRRAR